MTSEVSILTYVQKELRSQEAALCLAFTARMAHVTQNIVKGTYNKAQLMPTIVKMMTEWAIFIINLVNS